MLVCPCCIATSLHRTRPTENHRPRASFLRHNGGVNVKELLSLVSASNRTLRRMTELGVRRAKAAFFSGCESHPATIVPAGSNRSSHGGNEVAEAFVVTNHL